jgi:flagellar assembly protein FliH
LSEVATFTFPQLDASPMTVGEIADKFAAAQRDADELREHARAEGFAAGHAAGLEAARAEAAAGIGALAAGAGALASVRAAVIAELEQDALALAFELAEQILAGAVAVQPERVADVARHALRHLTDRRHVTLVVNPEDLAFVSAEAGVLQAELGGIDHLAVQADRRVERGGAIARTDAGEIDLGLSVQLGRARELVVEALSERLPDAVALTRPLGTSRDDDATDPHAR